MEATNCIVSRVAREFKLFRAFSKSDSESLYFPAAAYALVGLKLTYATSPTPTLSVVKNILSVIIWASLYMYIVNLSNQLYSIEEDRINKPDRPLPSGQVTFRGARLRWIACGSLFILSSIYDHSLMAPNLLWILGVYMLCFSRLGAHWFFKNVIGMGIASWVFNTAIGTLAGPLPDDFQRHRIAMCAWAGLTHSSQDWRDVIGDAKVGRNTLPIAFGDVGSRWVYVLVMLPGSMLSLWFGGILSLAPVFLTALHVALGYRAICGSGQDRKYDHQTYNLNILIHFCLYGTISYHYLQTA